MKKYAKKIVSVFSIAVLLVALISSSASAATFEMVTLPTYRYSEDNVHELNYLNVEGVPVPYVEAAMFMTCLREERYICVAAGDGTYKVGNQYVVMTVDPAKDTVSFEELELFQNGRSVEDVESNENKYVRTSKLEYTNNPNPVTLNLAKYGIDIIESDGTVFFPLTTIAKITDISYNTSTYSDGKVSFYHSILNPIIDCSAIYNNMTRDSNEVSFTYRELCFMIDSFYGAPSKCRLSDSIRAKGLDATLESYSDESKEVKKLLNSTNAVDLMFGIACLSNLMFDGGHTELNYKIGEYSNTPVIIALKEALSNESDPRTILYGKTGEYGEKETENSKRIKEYAWGYDNYEPLFVDKDPNGSTECKYYEYEGTGIFVFDEFESYVLDSLYKALDLAKEHGINNFLFDLSANEGGDTSVMSFILGAVTNDSSLYMSSPIDNNTLARRFVCDYNQDGVFESSNDTFNYDFNYAVLCSNYSYSCGNTLPCRLKEAGIPVLGETSGGGTCIIGYVGLANTIRNTLSSGLVMSYKDGKDMDDGVSVDYDLTKLDEEGLTDYSDFHNFELIDEILDKHYGISDTPESDNQNAQSLRDGQTLKVSNVPKTGDFNLIFYYIRNIAMGSLSYHI
ncbi:MAG: S41 family peptidase [Lachnospiraceae bacterium]|nr:S41 family peptidase [Lachnospiraceae bacterium]